MGIFSEPPYIWLILAALFLAVEAFGATGVGFLFAGLGAILTAIFAHFGWAESLWAQLAWFFGMTVVWGAMLWKPMKKFRISKSGGQHYSNMVGGEAVVLAPGLKRGVSGKVRWSGTTMEARLAEDAPEEIAVDARVTIREVKGNTLVVTPA
jgi:membrane protein implicated in regulation of membrane protease activity